LTTTSLKCFGDQKGEGGARNVCCPKSSQSDIKEKTVGEGQNGWLVPGEKREMAEERRIARGISCP